MSWSYGMHGVLQVNPQGFNLLIFIIMEIFDSVCGIYVHVYMINRSISSIGWHSMEVC